MENIVDSSEQAEKDETLMELWEDQISKPMQVLNVPIRTSAGKLRPNSGRQLQRYTLRKMAAGGGCTYWFPLLYGGILPIYIQSNEEHTEHQYYVPRRRTKNRLPCRRLPQHTSTPGTLLVYPQKFTRDIRSVYLIEKLILT